MREEYIEIEDSVVKEISIKNSIEQLEPEIIEMILEEHGDMDTYIDSIDNKESVNRILEFLSDRPWREQKVIILRFGLIDGRAKTLEEVAQIMGVTRERIRQIERKALRRGCCRIHRRKRLIDFLEGD